MRNALLLCLLGALSLSACKLDTSNGNSAVAPVCGEGTAPCDGGTPTSSVVQPDAASTTGTNTPAVMTGRGGEADAGMMSSSNVQSGADPNVPPPPPPKKVDGDSCTASSDCISGHCLHNLCCAGGDCCRMPSDCPKTVVDGLQVACNEPSACQGRRGEVRCENFLCVADGEIPDDSACTSQIVKDCTPYKAVTCNGMMEQQEPPCPTSCASDADCVESAHCDTSTKTCEMDAEDGNDCRADHDCVSNHCNRGVCCKSGDCCTDATGCLLHNTLPMCVDVATCTGSVTVAMCKSFQCTSEERPSTTICNGMPAERCGLYQDVTCNNGTRAQCATSCRVDTQCKPEAYCKQTAQGGTCEPKLKDGDACTASSQCRTTCNHGFCCGDTNPDTYCCGTNDDCRTLNTSGCVSDQTSCDGRVTTATCNNEHRCVLQTRADPNACTNRSIECGAAYKTRAACPLGCGCNSNADCNAGYICMIPAGATRGVCQVDPMTGGMSGGGPGPGPGTGGMGNMP